ncbi:hypothetical protein CEXT_732331 [Caerostris extrusa]|uniref:Ycf15 n=1 Tax=Caerostris extrusa TaxID=172846 RepID=A0AAV4UYR7_CAEEX|nr:hypothetical protein CEXT_732331 [Caerostris extrusa]
MVFMASYKQTSRGDKSGDLGDHVTRPLIQSLYFQRPPIQMVTYGNSIMRWNLIVLKLHSTPNYPNPKFNA